MIVIKIENAVGARKPPCEFTIRIDREMKTNSARYGAAERKRKGIPIDQCGLRSDFIVDGRRVCRAHAGAMALEHVIATRPTHTGPEPGTQHSTNWGMGWGRPDPNFKGRT